MHTETRAKRIRSRVKPGLLIGCPQFGQQQPIPRQYTGDGANINPQLDIRLIPRGTRTLAVIVSDADSYTPGWVHWVAWDIPVTRHIREAHVSGVQGINDYQLNGYSGPAPQQGKHRYHYKVYALDRSLGLPERTTARQLERAMEGHVLAWGEVVGTYERT